MIPRPGDKCGTAAAQTVHRLLAQATEWVAPLGRPDWSFDLVLVGDTMMQDLNARFRGKDAVTDVLSFSALEDVGTGDPDLAAGVAGAWGDLWLDPLQVADPGGVGEIILAPDFIVRRCQDRGWPLEKEIPMLVIHGCLHLLGWDHMEPEQGCAMRRLEAERLAACGLEHPLDVETGEPS